MSCKNPFKNSNPINLGNDEGSMHSSTTYGQFSSSSNEDEDSGSDEEPICIKVRDSNERKQSRVEHLLEVKEGSSRRWQQPENDIKKVNRLSQCTGSEESFPSNENGRERYISGDQRWNLTTVADVYILRNQRSDDSVFYKQVDSTNVLAIHTLKTESYEVATDDIDHFQLPTSLSNEQNKRKESMDEHSLKIERPIRRQERFQSIISEQSRLSKENDNPCSQNGNGGTLCTKKERNEENDGYLSDNHEVGDGSEIEDYSTSEIYKIAEDYVIDNSNIATSASHIIQDQTLSDKSPDRKLPDPEPVSKKKTLYKTDITNKSWNFNVHITERNGCQLWRENSDVTLSIPPDAVDVTTRISGSVIVEISELRHIFNLESEELIVAPAVEFQIEKTDFLHKHACIQIPHCMSQNVDSIQVWCFSHDRSVQKTYKKVIPAKGRIDPDACSDDIFWTIKDLNTINVFTKHFSGFLCTACDKHVDIRDIRGYLFNTFGVLDGHTTLSISLQLAGPLSRITDFEKSIISDMNKRDYSLVTKKKIAFDRRKEGCLLLSFEMLGSRGSDWQPVQRVSGKHAYDTEQEVALDQLLTCGNEHIIASENEWYLQYKSAVRQRCSVCVDVKHIVDTGTKPIQTTMHGELLPPPRYEHLTTGANNYNLDFLQPKHIISQEPKECYIISDAAYVIPDEKQQDVLCLQTDSYKNE
ncbi:uncharacterized protein [Argopecten irradians]|uniref:uncharacterized protein n=1 Tax=Argopecten irradians TaxID=31199 RepID=UPI00372485BE